MDTKQRFHPLDRLIVDDSLFFLEAMVPFVDYQFKKLLVLFIKFRELNSIMKCLDDRSYISKCGFDCKPNSAEDMISNMCNFLPGDYASSFKQMKQMMSMMEMVNMSEMMNNFDFGSDNSDRDGSMPDFSNLFREHQPPPPSPQPPPHQKTPENDFRHEDESFDSDANLFDSVMSILENEPKEH